MNGKERILTPKANGYYGLQTPLPTKPKKGLLRALWPISGITISAINLGVTGKDEVR